MMEKETFLDKTAKKAFESARVQQSWTVHMQMFGPILEPAFREDYPTKVNLCAALNRISRRESQKGMELLEKIRKCCTCDADMAALAFFVGLCYEMGGEKEKMLQWYAEAGKYHHRFYLPYLKLAKAAQSQSQLEEAKEYYEAAIACFPETPETKQDEIILGSAYANLASCLIMQHQYPAAESAWKKAQQFPLPPGADATAAILYAAMGDAETTASYIEALKRSFPAMVGQIETMTRQILAGEHPEFMKQEGR